MQPQAPAEPQAEPAKTEVVQEIPRGLALLNEHQCTACHSMNGSLLVATTFKGILGRKQIVLTNGKERRITIDEGYFKKSILEPNADIVKGFDPIMPETEAITEEQIGEMIEYVKGLK